MSDNTHSTTDKSSNGTTTGKRFKHDIDLVNEADARLMKIKALGDLLLCTRSIDLADDTVSNIGWLLVDLARETSELVNESEEVPA